MNNNEFQLLLNKLAKYNAQYKSALRAAEDEIEKRFGVHPSDIDNDSWIDTFHVGLGGMTVKEVEDSMKLHKK